MRLNHSTRFHYTLVIVFAPFNSLVPTLHAAFLNALSSDNILQWQRVKQCGNNNGKYLTSTFLVLLSILLVYDCSMIRAFLGRTAYLYLSNELIHVLVDNSRIEWSIILVAFTRYTPVCSQRKHTWHYERKALPSHGVKWKRTNPKTDR